MEPLVYLTRSEFTRILGVSTARVTQMVSASLPVLKDGGVELGLTLWWVSHTAIRGKSRHPDRGCRRVDDLLRELADVPGSDAARDAGRVLYGCRPYVGPMSPRVSDLPARIREIIP